MSEYDAWLLVCRENAETVWIDCITGSRGTLTKRVTIASLHATISLKGRADCFRAFVGPTKVLEMSEFDSSSKGLTNLDIQSRHKSEKNDSRHITHASPVSISVESLSVIDVNL